MEKRCYDCKETKPVERFSLNRSAPDGRQNRCKECFRRYNELRRDEQSARALAWQKANPRRAENNRLMWRFGIGIEQFDEMLQAQSGRCAICTQPMRSPQVDHDHTTKRVRGLLCKPCNIGIGQFNDDPATLRRAAEYLT